MAQLAIKGHATRGKEVIEILEMLGGKNLLNQQGHGKSMYSIDDSDNLILYLLGREIRDDLKVFTLGQFLEKFPYKVGDKVIYDKNVCEVIEMMWDNNLNTIAYRVSNGKRKDLVIANELQHYKEQETLEETNEDLCVYDKLDFTRGPAADKVELVLGDYEIKEENGKTFLVKKQPKYPKTYEECCRVLGKTKAHQSVSGYKAELLENFQQLLICRDAYWKIAGNWKPSITDIVYTIMRIEGKVVTTGEMYGQSSILEFSTEEMRDAFYENFKELIEEVKELL